LHNYEMPIGGLNTISTCARKHMGCINACARKHMGCINACARKHK
jgi:hypothetical protein